jgi:hypothetical protein
MWIWKSLSWCTEVGAAQKMPHMVLEHWRFVVREGALLAEYTAADGTLFVERG